ncbi:galactose inhibitable lectin 170 kDa subunit, putative [Entamoeba histolytica HM-3:IMSS]|uniref:Gal/GalNAc lectin heavy subunit, putative n=6 Tax=Entamoeba histolytica TaxID=5759 RepID=C4M7A1_ENTH1|nr:Gal/GalNAc lectin heavy subunit, putative [Entamoeba histolytica HM-1:IMSS]EMD49540.1 galactose-inhibitable lectin 170 kDa subunit, putative [Entamoeba histolytica KU27]EMS14504.1 galactose inhibitable lectin 170 kDa subunit, putative [Entamoeba histolytica HM-3:IMSS]ENY62008.1 galactose-inhibitable lectin, putative [Entamoeba histolytica HM-1:IMSS-A]GAT97399.1 gal galnac lectin heavy subunit putative [Entamoeba histolytica]EAL45148.1 Gal/GalNAc lectin heavy subunit, putative [Entamoeba his|eukprot:XP_650534.1 Gal/GalNAc lectin heavy subunit, putative [Entamoeba histolytica HM-1:IMSS]
MIILVLFYASIALGINLNEFSGTVDIQDKGRMGMGKNAASWSRSVNKKYSVFYYLTMQPWRNLEWTTIDSNFPTKDQSKYFTEMIFNQDYDRDKSDTKEENMCRKKMGYPIREYQLDWSRIPSDTSKLPVVSINGLTCYKYAAKPPLTAAYFLEKTYDVTNKYAEGMSPCRFEYIGGKVITFRSSSEFSDNFITDYKNNNITKCHASTVLPPTNNMAVGIVVNLDMTNTLRNIFSSIVNYLIDLFPNDTSFAYYINSQNPYHSDSLVTKDNIKNVLNGITVMRKGNETKAIETVYNQMSSKAGKNIVYISKYAGKASNMLNTLYSHNTTFYVFNLDSSIEEEYQLEELVNKGEHYFKSSVSSLSTSLPQLYNTIMANNTELCDRKTCKGFCDGGARCTCPMCCHSECYYTTCNTENGECVYYPSADHKIEKRKCTTESCLGVAKCVEDIGCTIEQNKCVSTVKCLEPYCSGNNCAFRSNCTDDIKPSSIIESGVEKFVCRTYSCDRTNGECIPNTLQSSSYCPKLSSKCEEYYCSAGTCMVQEKKCIKVSPYEENPCYEATCDSETGNCVMNLVGCSSGMKVCGKVNGNCRCDASTSYQCKCDTSNGCTNGEVCDYTDGDPKCINVDNCEELKGHDIVWEGCYKKVCKEYTANGTTQYVVDQEEYVCKEKVPEKCDGYANYVCSGNRECILVTTDKAIQECKICDGNEIVNKCEGLTTSQGIPFVCKDGECQAPDEYDCKDLFKDRLSDCEQYYEWEYANGECKVIVKDGSKVILDSQCMYCSYDNILVDPAKLIKMDCTNKKNINGIPYVCRDGSCHIDDEFDCTKHENFPSKCLDVLDYKLIIGTTFDEYKCEWNSNEEKVKSLCKYCSGMDKESTLVDKCPNQVDASGNIYQMTCSDGDCKYEGDCNPTNNCFIQVKTGTSQLCEPTNVTICPSLPPSKPGEVICMKTNCDASGSIPKCSGVYDDSICSSNTADVGCASLTGKCDTSTGYCIKKEFTKCSDEPSNDRDCTDKCYNYTCVETITEGVITHKWTSNIDGHEKALLYKNKCQDAYCDKETGEIETNFVQCDIDIQFPNMSKAAKNCFYCECSLQSESGWILTMYSDYADHRFSLDACGNCKINDELVDKDAVCLLWQDVDNTAAIAAGTTVAVVVAVIVVVMVIIAIGIKQTVDIVISARKNTVDNTVNNPQFTAKDDNATNANFNG